MSLSSANTTASFRSHHQNAHDRPLSLTDPDGGGKEKKNSRPLTSGKIKESERPSHPDPAAPTKPNRSQHPSAAPNSLSNSSYPKGKITCKTTRAKPNDSSELTERASSASHTTQATPSTGLRQKKLLSATTTKSVSNLPIHPTKPGPFSGSDRSSKISSRVPSEKTTPLPSRRPSRDNSSLCHPTPQPSRLPQFPSIDHPSTSPPSPLSSYCAPLLPSGLHPQLLSSVQQPTNCLKPNPLSGADGTVSPPSYPDQEPHLSSIEKQPPSPSPEVSINSDQSLPPKPPTEPSQLPQPASSPARSPTHKPNNPPELSSVELPSLSNGTDQPSNSSPELSKPISAKSSWFSSIKIVLYALILLTVGFLLGQFAARRAR